MATCTWLDNILEFPDVDSISNLFESNTSWEEIPFADPQSISIFRCSHLFSEGVVAWFNIFTNILCLQPLLVLPSTSSS
ncbi:unnamed protein product [Amoebophrya sp. A25]|nr:unnamed protein product [Amoebophrya sp. A25]|eukprot:GSA25T00014006001.1